MKHGKFTLEPCSRCGHLVERVSWNWLREQREGAQVSLREVARRLGFTATYICDIEHGRRRATDQIVKLYEGLA